jgi:hypothetical protein
LGGTVLFLEPQGIYSFYKFLGVYLYFYFFKKILMTKEIKMKDIVALANNRGFVYQGSEIYG